MSIAHINHKYQIDRAKKSDAPEIAGIHILSWHETYNGIMDSQYLSSLSITKRTESWESFIDSSNYNKSQIILTLRVKGTNEIIGFCAVGPARIFRDRFDSEIQAIYLLKKYQNKGLGKALFLETAKFVKSLKNESFYLGVLEQNKTVKFYEQLDGQLLKDFEMVKIGNYLHKEVFYSWRVDKLIK